MVLPAVKVQILNDLARADVAARAEARRGVPWQLWTETLTRRSVHGRSFGRALTDALGNAERISFNLTGIDDLAAAFKAGKGGFRYFRRGDEIIPLNATNTELATVVRDPNLLSKTLFSRDGSRVKTEDVLREIFGDQ